jgi:hypothetical protein
VVGVIAVVAAPLRGGDLISIDTVMGQVEVHRAD